MQLERFDVRVSPSILSNKLVVITGLAAAAWVPVIIIWLAF